MIDQACQKWLEERCIDVELASRYEIYTANIKGITGKSVLSFPYIENGVWVNEKFRMLPKEKFWQHAGRRKIFWNVDALKDPLLESGHVPLVITEGEMDALAAIQSGYPLSVSVPDGAPPAGPRDMEDHSGSDDQDGRYSFLWDDRDKLARIQRFVLATDHDPPGWRLREELISRLLAGRCSFVEYPIGCKDLNDVLMKYGEGAVSNAITTAKPCPVRGVYRFSDYPNDGALKTYNTGFNLLDPHFQMVTGEFVVITGIPQHGKSSFALQLLAQMALLHGWRSAIFSPEMKVMPVIRDRLAQARYKANRLEPEHHAWLEDNFLFIGSDPTWADDDDIIDLDFILDAATNLVLRDGIKLLLIDPWNEVEHAKRRDETMTDYVARGIRQIKRFARKRNVTVIVVAHPTKMERAKNQNGFIKPSLYDISDSSAWFNKCDHGIVIHRDFEANISEISVMKSRFDEAGEPGMVKMRFDFATHRFEPLS